MGVFSLETEGKFFHSQIQTLIPLALGEALGEVSHTYPESAILV